MRCFIILVFLLIPFVDLFSQSKIIGQITSVEHKPLEFATIIFISYNDSSNFRHSSITDMEGNYIFNEIIPDVYELKVSSIGYNPYSKKIVYKGNDTIINITDVVTKVDTIQEAVVTAKRNKNFADKSNFTFTNEQKARATTSFNLIQNISKIKINTVENTINTAHNGRVLILVNGINSDEADVLTIKPEHIIRIEYYDMPPARYNESNIESVINIITKQSIEGYYFMCNLQNAFQTGFGNDMVSIKYNRKNTQIKLLYYLTYRNYENRTIDNNIEYQYNNDYIIKARVGSNSPFMYRNQLFRLDLSRIGKNNWTYGIRLSPTFYISDRKNHQVLKDFSNTDINKADSKDDYNQIRPETNLYFIKKINDKQEVLFDFVHSYFQNDYSDFRYEINSKLDTTYFNYLDNESKRNSIIAEGVYKNKFPFINFNTGFKYSSFSTKQNIRSTLENSISTSSTSNAKIFTEFLFSGVKYSISTSFGLNYQKHENIELSTSYDFLSFQPIFSAQYDITSAISSKIKYSINPVTPQHSELSPTKYYFDEYLVFGGNPNLTPYNQHNSSIVFNFDFSIGDISIDGGYTYSNKPFLYNYISKEEYIFYSASQQKKSDEFYVSSELSISPFKNDIIEGSFFIEYFGFRNYYNELGLVSLSDWMYSADIQASYNNFSLNLSYNSGYCTLNSLSITEAIESSYINFNYKKNKMTFGLGMYYPLSKSWRSNIYNNEKALVKRNDVVNIYDNGRMFYVNFIYSFSSGLKTNISGKHINNQDNDSGILQTE